MKGYDERAWELEVMRCDDGDLLLSQGDCLCGCGDEVLIRLNPAHFALVGGWMNLVPASEVARSAERVRDRLNLLAAMVMTHTQEGDPLRAAAACLIEDAAPPNARTPAEDGLPRNCTGREHMAASSLLAAKPIVAIADENRLDLSDERGR